MNKWPETERVKICGLSRKKLLAERYPYIVFHRFEGDKLIPGNVNDSSRDLQQEPLQQPTWTLPLNS
jgi:hypothetical protein